MVRTHSWDAEKSSWLRGLKQLAEEGRDEGLLIAFSLLPTQTFLCPLLPLLGRATTQRVPWEVPSHLHLPR